MRRYDSYLWSPKRRADNGRNQFYENMKVVAPGDLVFSYWNTAIRAYEIVRSFGYDAPKPDEFGTTGRQWAEIGYRADVDYVTMTAPVVPRDELQRIAPLLPANTRHYIPQQVRDTNRFISRLCPMHWHLVVGPGDEIVQSDGRTRLGGGAAAIVRGSRAAALEEHELESLDAFEVPETEREAVIRL